MHLMYNYYTSCIIMHYQYYYNASVIILNIFLFLTRKSIFYLIIRRHLYITILLENARRKKKNQLLKKSLKSFVIIYNSYFLFVIWQKHWPKATMSIMEISNLGNWLDNKSQKIWCNSTYSVRRVKLNSDKFMKYATKMLGFTVDHIHFFKSSYPSFSGRHIYERKY